MEIVELEGEGKPRMRKIQNGTLNNKYLDRHYKTQISGARLNRTFSRDLFQVDRGKIRANHERR